MSFADHKKTRPTAKADALSRDQRRDPTPPEKAIWDRLRAGRLGGWKFRRQHALGPYSADFYCHEAALVVEVDGMAHFLRGERDDARDRWMSERGIRTVRLSAKQVMRDIESAVHLVERALAARTEEPSPGLAEPRPPSPAEAGEGF
jgi:very-short-patch-repair endonuclease